MKTKDSGSLDSEIEPVGGERPDADQQQALCGHKVRHGRRIIKNYRNEAGMSMKTKERRIQYEGLKDRTATARASSRH
jgi:hypothetical protein